MEERYRKLSEQKCQASDANSEVINEWVISESSRNESVCTQKGTPPGKKGNQFESQQVVQDTYSSFCISRLARRRFKFLDLKNKFYDASY